MLTLLSVLNIWFLIFSSVSSAFSVAFVLFQLAQDCFFPPAVLRRNASLESSAPDAMSRKSHSQIFVLSPVFGVLPPFVVPLFGASVVFCVCFRVSVCCSVSVYVSTGAVVSCSDSVSVSIGTAVSVSVCCSDSVSVSTGATVSLSLSCSDSVSVSTGSAVSLSVS